MTAATNFIDTPFAGLVPGHGTLSAAAGKKYFKGTIVTRDANGRAGVPVDGDGSQASGVAEFNFDNSAGLDDSVPIELSFGVFGFAFSGSQPRQGDRLYVVDNATVSASSNGGVRGYAGVCTESTTTLAYVELRPNSSAAVSRVGVVSVPIAAGIDIATNALLTNTPATTHPGTVFTASKAAAVEWLANATPGAIAVCVPMPADVDVTQPITVTALVSKSGATLADATKLTIGAFFQDVGALHDAAADAGGDSSAIATPAATAKTVSSLTYVIAANALATPPAALTLTIKPKAGTLATDNLFLHSVQLSYVKK